MECVLPGRLSEALLLLEASLVSWWGLCPAGPQKSFTLWYSSRLGQMLGGSEDPPAQASAPTPPLSAPQSHIAG